MFRWALVATMRILEKPRSKYRTRKHYRTQRERKKERSVFIYNDFYKWLLNNHDEATCQTKQAIDHNVS